MTIAILLIAALVLMITMLVLTLGVNELEKKGTELTGIIKKRYAPRQQAGKPGGAPPAHGQGGGPPPTPRSPGRT
jgi:hypothetical protein